MNHYLIGCYVYNDDCMEREDPFNRTQIYTDNRVGVMLNCMQPQHSLLAAPE